MFLSFNTIKPAECLTLNNLLHFLDTNNFQFTVFKAIDKFQRKIDKLKQKFKLKLVH